MGGNPFFEYYSFLQQDTNVSIPYSFTNLMQRHEIFPIKIACALSPLLCCFEVQVESVQKSSGENQQLANAIAEPSKLGKMCESASFQVQDLAYLSFYLLARMNYGLSSLSLNLHALCIPRLLYQISAVLSFAPEPKKNSISGLSANRRFAVGIH
jgi:hypothetical protein